MRRFDEVPGDARGATLRIAHRFDAQAKQNVDSMHTQSRTSIPQRHRKEVSAVLRSIAPIVDHAANIAKPSHSAHQAIPISPSEFPDP
jgi:hypothetical protein